jgi:UDP-2,3-diacylglucosamine pyrophosphatase LpxH
LRWYAQANAKACIVKSFKTAKFTAVISDLHLCEAEPPDKRFPLWKKYKTRNFFFDDLFFDFVQHIHERAKGEEVECILNGDIFDFDSVTALPTDPPYKISWLERSRGLYPEEDKSIFKIRRILEDHGAWVDALRWLLLRGHRVVFVIGNHDIELHWKSVQQEISNALALPAEYQENLRFVEWFYISNEDTLIEHGNQYDPFCVCLDPINPFIRRYNRIELRLPFGNIVCRYLGNGMGFFNPHVEEQFQMSMGRYLKFFFSYIVRAQPVILWTWFWGAFYSMVQSVKDSLRAPVRDPMRNEERIEDIAQRSNATSRMVRELRELFSNPATQEPEIIAKELWMDRAFYILVGLFLLLELFIFVKQVYSISIFWLFIPILMYVPFFLFYSQAVRSNIHQYKEPQERILALSTAITKTRRVIYGHTHVVRHEVIGAVEHLNSGTWSPGFLDVECTRPYGNKTFVWINPREDGSREAQVLNFELGRVSKAFRRHTAEIR